MDIISTGALQSFAVSAVWRFFLAVTLLLIGLSYASVSYLVHLSGLIGIWVVGEFLFIFVPNLIRHRRRWKRNQMYREAAAAKCDTDGALRTIYSSLLDEHSTHSK